MIDRRIIDWIDGDRERPDKSVHSTVGRTAVVFYRHRDQDRSIGIRQWHEADRAGGIRTRVRNARIGNQRRVARSSCDGQGLPAFITRPEVIPARLTVCSAASSLITTLLSALSVGALFRACTVIVNVCGAEVSTPPRG